MSLDDIILRRGGLTFWFCLYCYESMLPFDNQPIYFLSENKANQ